MMNNQINNVPEDLAQELQAVLTQTAEDVGISNIGVSVGVVTPDGTWTGATGISNIDTQQATKPDDLFNIASVSKPYTSAVILKLQEQGKLSLDDTINKWLPEIAANITNGDNLTIRQILNGTGGLWDYLNGDDEFISELIVDYLSGTSRDWQPEDLIAYAFDKPLFSGSTRSTEIWTYTNTGNVIAALIAEKATGKLFKDILAEEILEPLGLTNTFFTTEEVSLERRARGYSDILTADGNLGIDGIPEDYSIVNTEIAYGPGSIVSSAEDVAKFFNSLASGDLLQPESTAEIFNYVSTDVTEADKFGLGVSPSEYTMGETRSMNGSILGYISEVNYFLDSDTTISVLVNESSEKSAVVRLAYQAAIANILGLNDGSVIDGTISDNYLIGTLTNDVINGLAGDDILIGKKGLDAIDGGDGNDFIRGGKDNDVLFGKEGNDNLFGGKDDDFLNGGEGDDFLQGGKGSDVLIGGHGRDNINGGKDDDILSGGAGDDIVRDTQGNNIFYGNYGDDLLFAGKGDDALYGDEGNDRLIGNGGSDLLLGGSGDDYLNGGAGDDNLLGLEGDDILIGSSGSNILSGGAGGDRFVLASEGTAIITDFTQGEDFLELPENISFNELEIIQGSDDNADNTLINWQSANLAVLDNVDSTEINTSDFINLFPTFSLPEPTGDYAVGTTSYHFIDSEREETYTEDPNDKREITAKVWYPSVEVPEADTTPYFSEELISAIALGLDIPPADFSNVINSISTNSFANAPVAAAESEFPVLIFSHGFGDLPELNAVTAEELASQGYVVVALNHTYDSIVNILPDGQVIPQSSLFDEAENEQLLDLLAESIDIRAEDAQFVLDELEEIDAGDDPTGLFSGKLDLERVGMYGYSLGGATAAKVLSVDSRFQAGINLDGRLLGEVTNASLSQPFMFLNNEAFGTEDSFINQMQQSFVENLQNDGYEVTITGTEHSNFSDFSLISSILLNSGIESEELTEILTSNGSSNFEPIDPQLALEITRDYTVAFFEQYLNDRESPLLSSNFSPYPEVIFQPYNNDDYILSSMNLFRFSNSSADLDVIDFTTGEADKHFSLDGGQTEIAQLSTEFYLGDGGQTSHWKQEEGIASGEIIDISYNDLQLLDAIDWDII